ncbi:type II toxin-antitoxin system VapC family toxin [bacterium]|nr:type II toxin-antitoxin system VapC family toxin [bacterium]MBU1982880.1 type II toxin-antitoxin system VapC family toxin [bacterium]
MKCLDTTVLIYAADTASPFHKRATELLEQSVRGQWAACICEQSLHELAAVLTSSRFVRKPLSPAIAWRMIDKLVRYPQPVILCSDETILRRAFKLMEKYPIQRERFAETHLAATMLAHEVKTIVTADSAAFTPIREIDVENPFEALFA